MKKVSSKKKAVDVSGELTPKPKGFDTCVTSTANMKKVSSNNEWEKEFPEFWKHFVGDLAKHFGAERTPDNKDWMFLSGGQSDARRNYAYKKVLDYFLFSPLLVREFIFTHITKSRKDWESNLTDEKEILWAEGLREGKRQERERVIKEIVKETKLSLELSRGQWRTAEAELAVETIHHDLLEEFNLMLNHSSKLKQI